MGGLGEARRIAEFADSYYVAPHNASSSLGTIASAHCCASIPNFLALEFHESEVPFRNNLVDGIAKPTIQDGYIFLPGNKVAEVRQLPRACLAGRHTAFRSQYET